MENKTQTILKEILTKELLSEVIADTDWYIFDFEIKDNSVVIVYREGNVRIINFCELSCLLRKWVYTKYKRIIKTGIIMLRTISEFYKYVNTNNMLYYVEITYYNCSDSEFYEIGKDENLLVFEAVKYVMENN